MRQPIAVTEMRLLEYVHERSFDLRVTALQELAARNTRPLDLAARTPQSTRGGSPRPQPSPCAVSTRRRRLCAALEGSSAMPQSPSTAATPPQTTTRAPERSAWDVALKPVQLRAQRGRVQLYERGLAETRQRRLITAWLRQLASR